MADVLEDYNDEAPSMLLPCVSCNRTFRPEALAKHSKVCEKTLMKKRKKFDSSKQRIQGTDLAEFLPVLPTFTKKVDKSPVRKVQAHPTIVSSASKTSLTSPKSKWREKHNELVQTIQAARLPPGQAPPSPIKPTGQEQCPYCERSFGPKAYDRHLEWCKEQRTRIQPKSPASQRAKQRLEARTKYRAPLANKGKQRSVSRDKYPPGGYRDPSPSPQTSQLTPASIRKHLAATNMLESVSAPNINQTFMKGTPLRSSTRSVSVKKTTQPTRARGQNNSSAQLTETHQTNLHHLDHYLQPIVPWKEEKYSDYHVPSRKQSLNRKSPVGGEQEKEVENSGVARFCHECGAKYPVTVAKFCCQCGMRRLII